MSNSAENRMINAIDNKVKVERGTTDEELLAILVTSGLIPPTEEMPLKRARGICKDVYRSLAGINFMQQMYSESLKDIPLSQTAAAFPYVLKKEPEETTINLWDMDPLEGMSEEEKAALKKFTVAAMRAKVGVSGDE